MSSLFAPDGLKPELRALLWVEGLDLAFGEVGEDGDGGLEDGPAQEGNGSADGEDGIGQVGPAEVAEKHGGKHDAGEGAGGELGGEFAVGFDLEEHDAHDGSAKAACHADEAEVLVNALN